MNELSEFEKQILREVAGELPASTWGAAVGVVLEELYEGGYITTVFGGKLTDKGRKYLEGMQSLDEDTLQK